MVNHIVLLDGTISSVATIFNLIRTVNLKDQKNRLTIIEPRSDLFPLYSKSYEGLVTMMDIINKHTEKSSGISYSVVELQVGETKNAYNKYQFKNVMDKNKIPSWFGFGQIPLKINAFLFGIDGTQADKNVVHWSDIKFDNNGYPYGNGITPMDLANIEEIFMAYMPIINRKGNSTLEVIFDNRDKDFSDLFKQLILDMEYLHVSLQDTLSILTGIHFCSSKTANNCYFDTDDLCYTCKHVKKSLENLQNDLKANGDDVAADLIQRVIMSKFKIYNQPAIFPYAEDVMTSEDRWRDMMNYLFGNKEEEK